MGSKPVFFKKCGPFTLSELLEAIGDNAKVVEEKEVRIYSPQPLDEASSSDITFIDNKKYVSLLEQTKAGVIIAPESLRDILPKNKTVIICTNPYLAWSRVMRLFYPLPVSTGKIHPNAVIADTAVLGDNVEVGPCAVIEDRVIIGEGSIIKAHAWIGPNVHLGKRCRVMSHASVSHAVLDDDVIIHGGARIGEAGFGFAVNGFSFETVPQIGCVRIGKFAEIGANSTIDRGSVKDTVISEGTRIDNLVQIGHNVQTGKSCIIVAQAGISGSTKLGDGVQIAAQAGLIGHISVGDKARVGAQCGVMNDIAPKADVIGSPAVPFWEFFKTVAMLRKMVNGSNKDNEKK